MLHNTPKTTMCKMLMLRITGMSCRGGSRSRPSAPATSATAADATT